jgi:hypothetical protein
MKERQQNIEHLSGQSAQEEELRAMGGMQAFMFISFSAITIFYLKWQPAYARHTHFY